MNKDLPLPLYHQLKEVLLKGIAGGQWKPNEQLPTENDLAAQFSVSKITVRQALQELSNLGYVRREQGRGTFVQKPKLAQGPRELTSFTEEMRRHGLRSTSRVLEQETITAAADVAAKLAIEEFDPVFKLRRLRLANGEPMGIQTSYIPLELVPGIDTLDFSNASLYEVLQSRYKLYPIQASETHIAVLADSEAAALLAIQPGSPAMAAERVSYTVGVRPIEIVRSMMRGDRYKIVLELVKEMPGS